MNSIDSNIAVILGGVSSINMTDKILKRTLTNMVKTLKKSKKNVYFVEAPYGMVGGQYFNGKKDGHNVFGTVKKENIDRYNKIIRQAGADGIIPFKDAPWRKGKLHGITMEFPKYFVDAVYRSIGKDC